MILKDYVPTCYMCGKEIPPFAGMTRGVAMYDDRSPESEQYIECIDLCQDCVKVFDKSWEDLFKLYPYNKEGN